jgi:hypothetical protein
LCKDEKQSKAALHSDPPIVVKNVFLLVFLEVLQETGYADQAVSEEPVSGAQLMGFTLVASVFGKRIEAARVSADALNSQPESAIKRARPCESQNEEFDRALD